MKKCCSLILALILLCSMVMSSALAAGDPKPWPYEPGHMLGASYDDIIAFFGEPTEVDGDFLGYTVDLDGLEMDLSIECSPDKTVQMFFYMTGFNDTVDSNIESTVSRYVAKLDEFYGPSDKDVDAETTTYTWDHGDSATMVMVMDYSPVVMFTILSGYKG